MPKNIVLVGLMGSGKSTIGKLLSEKLNMIFIDTDAEIEQKAKMSVSEIFAKSCETFFRSMEVEIIEAVSQKNGVIISTGGGSVENSINIENLKKKGVIFYLQATASELYNRIKTDTKRPLLKNDNPEKTLENLLIKREEFYLQADIKVETYGRHANDIVNEIIEKYRNYEH